MKDAFGRELKVGDRVAYLRQGYRELAVGEIAKICAKQVRFDIPKSFTDSLGNKTTWVDTVFSYPQNIVLAPEYDQERKTERRDAPPPGAGERL